MTDVSVLIAGGGPVGLTLGRDLAGRGVSCMVVERNETTTRHPKMDNTNVRSMELFSRSGLAPLLRAVAVPEDHPFDVSWVTTMAGWELRRFLYPSPAEARRMSRETNDGSQPFEPPMRVSQIEIEPVLKRALEAEPLAQVRFGIELVDFTQDAEGVTATIRRRSDGGIETVRCRYLVGCDGGGSTVRQLLGVGLEGEAKIMPRFMTHFRSEAREVLQCWGRAWHYQSAHGTLIAQNDRDIWTLHTRFPEGLEGGVDPSALIRRFVGRDIPHEILVANPWSPHLLIADRYQGGRVFLAGDAAHQYIPTGGYGMNTGIGDAYDLGWKLAAVELGFGGPELVSSYGIERRPVGLRNREGSRGHNAVRVAIGALYQPVLDRDDADGERARRVAAAEIARLGNAENESLGLEMGYHYAGSPIVAAEIGAEAPIDTLHYQPNTLPGARLPSLCLADGRAVYELLGRWFTAIAFGDADLDGLVAAARRRQVPLEVLRIDDANARRVYAADILIVRPDQHVAWRGLRIGGANQANAIISMLLGWPSE